MTAFWIVLAILALPCLYFIAAIIIGCFERQVVKPFVHGAPHEVGSYSRAMYSRAMLGHAVMGGFRHCDTGIHAKFGGALGAILLLSHDRTILAVVCEGAILKMPYKKTLLYSRMSDGSVLISTDELGVTELDPMSSRSILMNADFEELLALHRKSCAEHRGRPREFPDHIYWADYDALETERAERVVQRGCAYFIDESKSAYRYTVLGSIQAVIPAVFKQVLRPSNYTRAEKARPGS